MLRRPPRSTLFPYTTPLPISTEENYASLNLVHSCWTDRGGDCEIGHACAHDYFLDHRARHHRIDHRRRSHSHVDRKSTRLNSSHVEISYAVFCLKKKTKDRYD